jgi:hypothetical protein
MQRDLGQNHTNLITSLSQLYLPSTRAGGLQGVYRELRGASGQTFGTDRGSNEVGLVGWESVLHMRAR